MEPQVGSLESRVHEHRLFFDSLVELVPAKYYIAKEEEQEDKSWHYGASKAKRAAAKQATKEHLKKAKRDRLDPDKPTSTLKLLQQKTTKAPESTVQKNDEEKPANSRLRGTETRASTYEELRERLYKRIKMLREERNANAAADAAKNAKKWKMQKQHDSKKQKRKSSVIKSGIGAELPSISKRRKVMDGKVESIRPKGEDKELTSTFEFGRVKMGLETNGSGRKKRKGKESKEQLLKKATKLQLEMQDPQKGQEVSSRQTWSVAARRASGEKVLDDSKLLKQSIKREKQQRQKSSKKWADRKETVKRVVEAKQETRTEHIKERKQQNKERQMAKREKKLLRPGFEGRREGFINA